MAQTSPRARAHHFARPQEWPPRPNVPAGNRTIVFVAFVSAMAVWTVALAVLWLPETIESKHYVIVAMLALKGTALLFGTHRLHTALVLGRGRRRV